MHLTLEFTFLVWVKWVFCYQHRKGSPSNHLRYGWSIWWEKIIWGTRELSGDL